MHAKEWIGRKHGYSVADCIWLQDQHLMPCVQMQSTWPIGLANMHVCFTLLLLTVHQCLHVCMHIMPCVECRWHCQGLCCHGPGLACPAVMQVQKLLDR